MGKSHEQMTREAFDSYCKKLLNLTAKAVYRELMKLSERETSFSHPDSREVMKMAATDSYFRDTFSFSVMGEDIAIEDFDLGKALSELPTARREIILMYYFLGMNDRVIGEHLNLMQRTVGNRRNAAMNELRQTMKGE